MMATLGSLLASVGLLVCMCVCVCVCVYVCDALDSLIFAKMLQDPFVRFIHTFLSLY